MPIRCMLDDATVKEYESAKIVSKVDGNGVPFLVAECTGILPCRRMAVIAEVDGLLIAEATILIDAPHDAPDQSAPTRRRRLGKTEVILCGSSGPVVEDAPT